MTLTYRELQAKLRFYRDEHGIELSCKLNASKEVLEDELASIRSSLFDKEVAVSENEDEVLAVDIDALSQVSEMLVKEDFPIVLATSNLLMVNIGTDKPVKLCRYHDKILLVTPVGVESEHLDLDEVMKTMRQLKTETENKNENDSRLEYQVSKLDAYIQTEVEMQIANINYVTIDLDRIGYWVKCSWHVVDFTKYPKISLKTEVIKGNDTLLNEETVDISTLLNRIESNGILSNKTKVVQSNLTVLEKRLNDHNVPVYSKSLDHITVGLSQYCTYATIRATDTGYVWYDDGVKCGNSPIEFKTVDEVVDYIESWWWGHLEGQSFHVTKERLACWLEIKPSSVNNALYSKSSKQWSVFLRNGETLHAPLLAARVPSMSMIEITNA